MAQSNYILRSCKIPLGELTPQWKAEVELSIIQHANWLIDKINKGELTIGAAEDTLFNVETYKTAKELELRELVIELLEWGMELSDVKEWVPEAFDKSIETMILLCAQVILVIRDERIGSV
jgi:hypothetical protein